MNRRDLILRASAAGGALAFAAGSASAAQPISAPHITWTAYSRHFQWVTTPALVADRPREAAVQVAKAALQAGFRAMDVTLRRGGHVDPQHAAERLPAFLAGLRESGVACEMITTDIVDLDTPVAADAEGARVDPAALLRIAAQNGIKRYKTNPANYRTTEQGPFGDEVKAQLKAFGEKLRRVEALNRSLGLQADYHTRSGGGMASSVWDFLYAAEGLDPAYVAFNYDIGHLFPEGAAGAWRTNFRVSRPYWGQITLKDADFGGGSGGGGMGPGPGGGARRPPANGGEGAGGGRGSARRVVEAGTGLVPFEELFRLMLQAKYSGPVEIQGEYVFEGVSLNNTFWPDGLPVPLSPEKMLAQQTRELAFFKAQAAAAGWLPTQQH